MFTYEVVVGCGIKYLKKVLKNAVKCDIIIKYYVLIVKGQYF